MKKHFRLVTLMVLGTAVVLSNCKGKDEDPNPQSTVSNLQQALENGFIKGTIKGKRKDGTAFEEAFEYKLASHSEGFEKMSASLHQLRLHRSESVKNYNYVDLDLVVENKGAQTQKVHLNDLDIEFSKVISGRNMFIFEAETMFAETSKLLPMSRTNNETYKLVNFGRSYDYYVDAAMEEEYKIFDDTEGSKIYFKYQSAPTYDYKFSYLVKIDGTKVTSSTIWNGVINDNDFSVGGTYFQNAAGTKLNEQLIVPADKQTISNFNYNAATGDLSFDYTLNIEQYREYNTTQNAVEIKGSVKVNVYDDVVARKSFENKQ